jgi:molybdate transport system substrate-binding protein
LSAALRILSAGAAQGAVTALAARLGVGLHAQFGAVAAMRQQLLEGAPCDVVVLTRTMLDALAADGKVGSLADIGSVRTSIAVREADALPDVSTAQALRAALLAADAIYFPDPERATAGIHFANVLMKLEVEGEQKTYPNGAGAMRAMVQDRSARVIGCTQETEIRNTPGARLVAPLPPGLELTTVYAAGVAAGARDAAVARRFVSLLKI